MKKYGYVPNMIKACCFDGYEIIFGYPLRYMENVNNSIFRQKRNDNALSANVSQGSIMQYPDL